MHCVRGRNKERHVWYLVRVSVVAHEVVFAYRVRSGEATVQSSNATRYDVHHTLERENETMFFLSSFTPHVAARNFDIGGLCSNGSLIKKMRKKSIGDVPHGGGSRKTSQYATGRGYGPPQREFASGGRMSTKK